MQNLNNDGWSDVSVRLVFFFLPTETSLPILEFTSCLDVNLRLDFNIFHMDLPLVVEHIRQLMLPITNLTLTLCLV